MSPHTDFKVIPATEANQVAIQIFKQEHFATSEPLNEAFRNSNNHANTSPGDFLEFFIVQEGLSLIATDTFGNIIGLIENTSKIEEDFVIPDNLRDCKMSCQIRNLLYTIDTVISSSKLETDKELEIAFIAVHKEWRRKGAAKALLQETMDLAKQKGFTRIRAICTGEYSKNLFLKYGFRSVCNVEYINLKNQGKLDVLPMSPHTTAYGVILNI